jgi:hypothetical protein
MYKRMALTNSIVRKLAMRLEKCRELAIPCDVGDRVLFIIPYLEPNPEAQKSGGLWE